MFIKGVIRSQAGIYMINPLRMYIRNEQIRSSHLYGHKKILPLMKFLLINQLSGFPLHFKYLNIYSSIWYFTDTHGK